MTRVGMPLIVVMVYVGGAGPLQAQTSLSWKFTTGDAFAVEQHISQATGLEAKNKPFQQKSTLTLKTHWQVGETSKEAIRLTVTVDSLASKISTGDGKQSVSSKEDELWKDAVFTLTADTTGKLREVQGHEQLLKKLAGGDPQRLKVLAALKPPEYFRALFQDVLGPLPAEPVKVGDRWRHASVEPMSIFGSLEQMTEFTYQGNRDGAHLVGTSTTSVYKAPRYAIENDVVRVLKGEVKVDEGKGELFFDTGLGRMRRVQKTLRLHGDLTLETLGGAQRVSFTSDSEMRIVVGDAKKR